MTSKPASRRARATILAPRSWPSSPGLATTTRILRSAIGLSLCERRANALARLRDRLAVARHQLPVEALAVVGPSRDQVQMNVGHGLEGRRPVGLEQVEPVRRERLLDGEGHALCRGHGRLEVVDVRLEERGGVALDDDQAMAGGERIDVHERERPLILVDLHRRDLTVPDLAEDALQGSDLDGPAIGIGGLAVLDP